MFPNGLTIGAMLVFTQYSDAGSWLSLLLVTSGSARRGGCGRGWSRPACSPAPGPAAAASLPPAARSSDTLKWGTVNIRASNEG